jgi:hypothetical protein
MASAMAYNWGPDDVTGIQLYGIKRENYAVAHGSLVNLSQIKWVKASRTDYRPTFPSSSNMHLDSENSNK